MCGLQRDTAASSNCSDTTPILPSLFHLDTKRPALMCQTQFVQVIIILATILSLQTYLIPHMEMEGQGENLGCINGSA